MALNLSVENVVDSENGYWAELTLEPAKKASPPNNIKKARSPLKEKDDNNKDSNKTFERVKSADAKRSSLLGEKVQKTKEHNQKVEVVFKESRERDLNKKENITNTLSEKIKTAEQIRNEQLEDKKRKATKSQEAYKIAVANAKREEEERQRLCAEKLAKAEEKRKEKERQIKLNNEQKLQRYLANKEKNIKNTPSE